MAATVLQKAKTQMVIQEPFYATILLNMDIVETKTLPDGRALWQAATNGSQIFINPENFNKLSVVEAKTVLKHEVMHIAQLHPWRGQGKEQGRWNQACDYAINPILKAEGGELPPGHLDNPSFHGMTAEQIYGLLPPEPPENKNNRGQKQTIDDDLLPPVDKTSAGQDRARTVVAQAAQGAKARGKLPQHIKEMIDDIFNPKVDWKDQLREWLTEQSNSDYSFQKPNRMFMAGPGKMYLPGMSGRDDMGALGALMDTSGSITMDELKQGLGEIVGAVEDVSPKKLIVAYCDAKVQHSDVFDNPGRAEVAASFERHGAGGTSMPAGLKWFARNHPNVQSVIVWTDGYTDWGNEEDYPFGVIWAISTPDIVAPWGTTIHVAIG